MFQPVAVVAGPRAALVVAVWALEGRLVVVSQLVVLQLAHGVARVATQLAAQAVRDRVFPDMLAVLSRAGSTELTVSTLKGCMSGQMLHPLTLRVADAATLRASLGSVFPHVPAEFTSANCCKTAQLTGKLPVQGVAVHVVLQPLHSLCPVLALCAGVRPVCRVCKHVPLKMLWAPE